MDIRSQLKCTLGASQISETLKEQYFKYVEEIIGAEQLAPCITIDDIPHELEYQEETKLPSFNTHIGQRKLFISELQFLTEFTSANQPTIIIYAGAAPSNHTGLLSRLFPYVRFLLVDPNKFDIFDCPKPFTCKGTPAAMVAQFIQERNKICIINGLFTGELASELCKQLAGRRYLFISDIRTNTRDDLPTSKGSEALLPEDLDIVWNLAQQFNWIQKLRPEASMLKFKHPFYDSVDSMARAQDEPFAIEFAEARTHGIDFVANFAHRQLKYLPGKCNIQCWQGNKSTETRLITQYDWIANPNIGCELIMRETYREYENKLFYYNCCRRGMGFHVNSLAFTMLGFDHCGDCAIEYDAWKKYYAKFKPNATETDILDNVAALSKNTRRELARDAHGYLFSHFDSHLLEKYIRLHNGLVKLREQSSSGGIVSQKTILKIKK